MRLQKPTFIDLQLLCYFVLRDFVFVTLDLTRVSLSTKL